MLVPESIREAGQPEGVPQLELTSLVRAAAIAQLALPGALDRGGS
jgi:hypothetical protein